MNAVRGDDDGRDVEFLLGGLAQLVAQMESALPRLEEQVQRLERLTNGGGGGISGPGGGAAR